jgi:ribose transport system permease protein
VWGSLIALYTLAWGIKGLQLTFSSNTNWIEPLFQGVSLLLAVSLASRQAVVKVRKRKAGSTPVEPLAPPGDIVAEPPAGITAD